MAKLVYNKFLESLVLYESDKDREVSCQPGGRFVMFGESIDNNHKSCNTNACYIDALGDV